jgi:hypothetical protein
MEISQEHYIQQMLHRFNMQGSNGVDAPYVSRKPTTKEEMSAHRNSLTDRTEYMQIIGSLLWISTWSRPDVAFAVNRCARNVAKPTIRDLNAARLIMKYLKQTSAMVLQFRRSHRTLGIEYQHSNSDFALEGYSDSDWAGDPSDAKSTSGVVVTINGNPVYWKSKKQSCVAKSVLEAEFVAATEAVRHVLWLRRFIETINGISRLPPTPIHIDNLGAIQHIKDDQQTSKTRHINVCYYFIRDAYANKYIIPLKIPTADNLADIFTKFCDKLTFARLRSRLQITVSGL